MTEEGKANMTTRSSQVIDYEAVLKDLERQREQMNARFDAAIAAIRQVLVLQDGSQLGLFGLPAETMKGAANRVIEKEGEFPYSGGLGIVDAAKKHLGLVGGGSVPNPDLARALVSGGFEHKSKNFANTLNSVLRRRALQVGDVRKTKRGWRLVAERQPEAQEDA